MVTTMVAKRVDLEQIKFSIAPQISKLLKFAQMES